jgi:hypothetical protein
MLRTPTARRPYPLAGSREGPGAVAAAGRVGAPPPTVTIIDSINDGGSFINYPRRALRTILRT